MSYWGTVIRGNIAKSLDSCSNKDYQDGFFTRGLYFAQEYLISEPSILIILYIIRSYLPILSQLSKEHTRNTTPQVYVCHGAIPSNNWLSQQRIFTETDSDSPIEKYLEAADLQ